MSRLCSPPKGDRADSRTAVRQTAGPKWLADPAEMQSRHEGRALPQMNDVMYQLSSCPDSGMCTDPRPGREGSHALSQAEGAGATPGGAP